MVRVLKTTDKGSGRPLGRGSERRPPRDVVHPPRSLMECSPLSLLIRTVA